jgi:hypothetical protein
LRRHGGASGWRVAEVAAHPYQTLPDHCFWRRSIAEVDPADVDPVVRTRFKIARTHRVATAGSCFAQHIARHLQSAGFGYFVTETAHPLVAHLAAEYSYGVFTARYGNIYTARQFLQTIQRAYGDFVPRDDAWPAEDGRVIDPYRPRIQPRGFACMAELAADRRQHFVAIRRAVEESDVFVFTLGLTEAWHHLSDGAVYPLCPGVAGGTFDPTQHGFVNLNVTEVIADLSQAVTLMLAKNPGLRIVLTVSPVPLVATMEDRSVLRSTTYSKAVLRVAAEEVAARFEAVDYFPSYEVITGNHARGRYFDATLREVTPEGVAHVMRLFMRHYAAEGAAETAAAPAAERQRAHEQIRQELVALADVICDELVLDAQPAPAPAGPGEQPPRPAPTQAPEAQAAATPAPKAQDPAAQDPAAQAARGEGPGGQDPGGQDPGGQDPKTPASVTKGIADPGRAPTAWDVLSGAAAPRPAPPAPPPPPPPRRKGLWSWFTGRR